VLDVIYSRRYWLRLELQGPNPVEVTNAGYFNAKKRKLEDDDKASSSSKKAKKISYWRV
jgi:hypothetical protein